MCFWFLDKKIKLNCGLKIDNNKVKDLPTKEIYEAVMVVMCNELGLFFDLNNLSDWVLQWGDSLYKDGNGYRTYVVSPIGNLCAGSTSGGHTCKVAWRGKIHKSAFIHELLHALSKETYKDLDASHSRKDVWEFEKKINNKLKEMSI